MKRASGFCAAFSAAIALCAAMNAQAAGSWTGNGANTLWNTTANWDSMPGSSASLSFRNANVKNRTATINGSYSYSGNIHMGAGSSADNPYIWEATDPANKLTVQDDTWLGYYENGWLWIKSGTYVFNGKSSKNFHMGEGASGARHNFWLKLGDGSSTVSVQGRNGYVRGGSALIADKATIKFTEGLSFSETASMSFTNSSVTVARDLNVANSSGANCVFRGTSSTVRQTTDGYVFNVGINSNARGVVEKDGGDWTCYYLRLGSGNGAKGIFTMDGGTLTVVKEFTIGMSGTTSGNTFTLDGGTVTSSGNTYIGNASGASGSLVLNGGTFTAKSISSSGTGKIVLDGGTLAASAAGTFIPAAVSVEVGANGGTIDTAWHDITLASGVSDVSGENGTITFTGGGTVTLTGALGCSAVTLDAGTVIAVADANKSFIANLTVDFSANGAGDGALVITNTSGTFSAADLAAIALAGNAGNRYALVLADGNTTIRVVDTLAGEYVWNDGASEADWTAAGKWSKGGVAGDWFNSTYAVFANAGDKATLGANVTAVDVTFRADAEVLAGGGTLTVPVIVVSNGVAATIASPTAGPLAKEGEGTLTLGSSRVADATALSEGTLAFSGTAEIDWTKLTFGTDPAKPVTLRIGPDATIANKPLAWTVGTVAGVTSTVVKAGGDWTNSNFYIADAANATTTVIQEGGTWTLSSTVDLGKAASAAHAYFDIAGGTVQHDGYIHNAASCPATVTVRTGAKYEMTESKEFGFIVSGGAKGTLNVQGGEALVKGPLNFCYRSGNGEANVTDGGKLSMEKVQLNAGTGSSGTAALTLDGGTLSAVRDTSSFMPDNSRFTFTVGANGGTIDTDGKNITLLKAVSGTGGLTFTGGGTAKLTATPSSYTGVTTVELGTILHIPSKAGFTGGFAVTGPAPEEGTYKVIVIDGDDAFAAIPEGFVAPEGCRFVLSPDGKTIYCVSGNPVPVWIGGASGSLSVASNWSTGAVPDGDPCIIGNDAAAALETGDTFAPTAITFPADTAAVTISGGGISGILAISNLSTSASATFLSPVSFAEGRAIEVYHTATYTDTFSYGNVNGMVLFKGGVTGYEVRQNANSGRSNIFAGEYRRTTTASDFKATRGGSYRTVVYKNSSLTVDTATDIWELGIDNGGAFTTRVATVRDDGTYSRLCLRNDGEIVVTEELLMTATSDNAGYLSLSADSAKGNVYKAGKLTIAGSDWVRLSNKSSDVNTTTVFVGDDGIVFKDSGSRFSTGKKGSQSGTTTIRPWHGDFAIGERTGDAHSIAVNKNTVFDTNDESGTGRRITVNATVDNANTVTVTGSGTVRYNRMNSNRGALTVSGTATLELGAGAETGTGAVTVNTGATLSVPEAGTGTVGGNLTLANGAALAFKLDGDNETTLALASGKTLAATATVGIKFIEGTVLKPGKSYTLVSGANLQPSDKDKFSPPEGYGGVLSVSSGNLVYTAPEYFYIRVADNGRFSLKDESDNVINVDIPVSWIYAKTGESDSSSPSAIATALADPGANGIPAWQSYCLGLDPQDAASTLLCEAAAGQPSDGKVNIAAKNLNVPAGLSGVAVTAYLDRKNGDGWDLVASAPVSSGSALLAAPAIESGTSFFA